MDPFLSAMGTAMAYVLVLQPFLLLQILPFRARLQRERKKMLAACWLALSLLAGIALAFLIVRQQIQPGNGHVLVLTYAVWLLFFLLSLVFSRQFLVCHFFILSFRLLLSSIFRILSQNLFDACAELLPQPPSFLGQLCVYGLFSLAAFPFLLRYFTKIFAHFGEASAQRYWRLTSLVAALLAVDMIVLRLFDMEMGIFDEVRPQLLLLGIVLLIAAAVRSGQKDVYRELQVYEKQSELQKQFDSTETYVAMSRQSRERMRAIYREKKGHVETLLELARQRDKAGFLACLEELGERFNRTKMPQYCRNALVNATLTVYLARAKERHIPVTATADVPQELSCSGEFSIVLANLVENAIFASEKQPADRRNIAVIAVCSAGSLNLLVKNQFDAPVPLGEDGLPVTDRKGHGIGMQSLAQFRQRFGASVLCQQKGGWFMTYLQVPLAGPVHP